MIVKGIIKIPKKDIVIPDYIMRPLKEEGNDEIRHLSDSIGNNGMINEIDVRLIDGRYELMAGARRFVATKEDDILAKVYENVSDLKAMVIGLVENAHRKNPDILMRDAYIYKVWKKGKADGEFKYIKDLAKEINMSENMLSIIISGGGQKEKSQSPVIQKATSRDLDRTKSLSNLPDIREDLLKKEQDNQLTSEGLEKISKEIKNEMDKGTKKEVVVKALELTNNTVKKYLKSNSPGESSGTSPPSPEIIGKISDKTFKDVLKTYKESPQDVKEKWEKGEIDIKDAKDLSKFESKDARDQVLKEIKTIDDKKEVAQKIYDKDRELNIEIRKKQEEEVKKTGDTKLKTEFDVELEKKLEMESNKDNVHDEKFIDRYQRLSSYTLETFKHFHPKRLKTEESKKTVSEIIRNIYNLYHEVLIETGNIKEIRTESGSDNVKRLEVGGHKDVKRT